MPNRWVDVTTIGSLYQIEYQPSTGRYRHRLFVLSFDNDLNDLRPRNKLFTQRGEGVWEPGFPPEEK